MGAYKPKKATFMVNKNKAGERVFTAVNKRAHSVVRKLGKRKHVSVQDLRASVGAGTYTFWAYSSDGSLSRIRF
jgi:hypothetical protein